MTEEDFEPPPFRDWSPAAIKLLHGAVYGDDGSVWDKLLRHQSRLDDYFSALGLRLVVDETDGFAYLRQLNSDDDGDLPEDYEHLPKLFRRTRLSYDATLLCVLLREELRRFDTAMFDQERCIIQTQILFEQWKSFFTAEQDEVRLKRSLDAALKKLEGLKYIRRIGSEPDEWEIRRILKARLGAAELEKLKADLAAAHNRKRSQEKETHPDD